MTPTEKQIREAVETIVCDVLYFDGGSPLSVAHGTRKIARRIVDESVGYKMLLRILLPEAK